MHYLGIQLNVRRPPNQPLVEVSCVVPEPNLERRVFFSLIAALKLISIIHRYGGALIPPFGDVPNEKNVFFVARFNSNKETEEFLKNLKN